MGAMNLGMHLFMAVLWLALGLRWLRRGHSDEREPSVVTSLFHEPERQSYGERAGSFRVGVIYVTISVLYLLMAIVFRR